MKIPARSSLVVVLAALALVAGYSIQQVSAADPNVRITTEKEYREKIVDKKLVQESGYVIVHKDGTMTGEFGNKTLSGTWTWEGEYYCRTVTVGTKDFGRDCQIVEISGDSMTVIRNKGSGRRSPAYRIEPNS